MNRLRAFWRDQSGATAVEYSLIAACIVIAMISDLNGFDAKLVAALALFGINLR